MSGFRINIKWSPAEQDMKGKQVLMAIGREYQFYMRKFSPPTEPGRSFIKIRIRSCLKGLGIKPRIISIPRIKPSVINYVNK
jgi:hypothetical protein